MPPGPPWSDIQSYHHSVSLRQTLTPAAAMAAMAAQELSRAEHGEGAQHAVQGEHEREEGCEGVHEAMLKEDYGERGHEGDQGDQEPEELHHIKLSLRLSAIRIYQHETFSVRYMARARDVENPLPTLLCLLHGFSVSDPRHFLRASALRPTKALPLAFWSSLYLALVAEIRLLCRDVSRELEAGSGSGQDLVLHNFGLYVRDENTPFLMIEFASQLEEIWESLMETTLLGGLEEAVRKQRIRQRYLEEHKDENDLEPFEKLWAQEVLSEQTRMLNEVEGMLDPTDLPPETIFAVVNERLMPWVRQACQERLRNERSQLTPQGQTNNSTRYATEIDGDLEEDTGYPFINTQDSEPHCICHTDCRCKNACQFEIQTCPCKLPQTQLSSTRLPRRCPEDREQFVIKSQPPQYQSLSTMSDSMAQLQLTPAVAIKSRQRSNTAQSDLIYVPDVPSPPAVPSRKDTCPLGFYGRDSGQRYPNFRRNDSAQPPAGHTPNSSMGAIPSRKPLPYSSTDAQCFVPPLRTRGIHARTGARNIGWPAITEATSTPVTESFPVPAQGNHRTENEFDGWDTSHVKTPVLAPAGQTGGIATNGGLLRHSVDSPSPRLRGQSEAQSSSHSATPAMPPPLNLDAPQNMPLPDFIQPRPSLAKQRYVPAGGTAKLADRPEIPGFALPLAVDPGMSMRREEYDQLPLASPQRRDSKLTTPRQSVETGSSPASHRTSRDLGDTSRNDKRSRTSSSVSTRIIKRLFSRQNSSSE